MNRRDILRAWAASMAMASGAAPALPEWPQKPVKIMLPFPPGAASDAVTRWLADRLAGIWGNGRTALVDNRSGGNTIIAASALLNEARDNHTFLATINLTRQLPFLGIKLPFNPVTDLVPVGPISLEQLVLVANARSGAADFTSMVSSVQKKPAGAMFGTFGIGGLAHLTALQLGKALNLNVTPVHYRGAAPALLAVLSGEVDLCLANLGASQQYIASGKLVPLAVTGARRYRFVPQLPTLTEVGVPDLEFLSWIGMFAAKTTPTEITRKFGDDMRAALRSPELIAKFNGYYLDPGQQSTEEFQEIVRRDDEMAAKLFKTFGVRLE